MTTRMTPIPIASSSAASPATTKSAETTALHYANKDSEKKIAIRKEEDKECLALSTSSPWSLLVPIIFRRKDETHSSRSDGSPDGGKSRAPFSLLGHDKDNKLSEEDEDKHTNDTAAVAKKESSLSSPKLSTPSRPVVAKHGKGTNVLEAANVRRGVRARRRKQPCRRRKGIFSFSPNCYFFASRNKTFKENGDFDDFFFRAQWRQPLQRQKEGSLSAAAMTTTAISSPTAETKSAGQHDDTPNAVVAVTEARPPFVPMGQGEGAIFEKKRQGEGSEDGQRPDSRRTENGDDANDDDDDDDKVGISFPAPPQRPGVATVVVVPIAPPVPPLSAYDIVCKEGIDMIDADVIVQRVHTAILNRRWSVVTELVELHPESVSMPITFTFRGERSDSASLLHEACASGTAVPLDVVDALVTAYPPSALSTDSCSPPPLPPSMRSRCSGLSSLSTTSLSHLPSREWESGSGDDRDGSRKCRLGAGRLPVHVAIASGASPAVVRYLLRCHPACRTGMDHDGNNATHYAAMFGTDRTIEATIEGIISPEGSRVRDNCGCAGVTAATAAASSPNKKGKLPLHLLCGRCSREAANPSTTTTIRIEDKESNNVSHNNNDGKTNSDIFNKLDFGTYSTRDSRGRNRDAIGVRTVRSLLEVYPDAAFHADGHGCLPLHESCNAYHPRWDVVGLLLNVPPPASVAVNAEAAARIRDDRGRTALDLYRMVRHSPGASSPLEGLTFLCSPFGFGASVVNNERSHPVLSRLVSESSESGGTAVFAVAARAFPSRLVGKVKRSTVPLVVRRYRRRRLHRFILPERNEEEDDIDDQGMTPTCLNGQWRRQQRSSSFFVPRKYARHASPVTTMKKTYTIPL